MSTTQAEMSQLLQHPTQQSPNTSFAELYGSLRNIYSSSPFITGDPCRAKFEQTRRRNLVCIAWWIRADLTPLGMDTNDFVQSSQSHYHSLSLPKNIPVPSCARVKCHHVIHDGTTCALRSSIVFLRLVHVQHYASLMLQVHSGSSPGIFGQCILHSQLLHEAR